MTLTLLMHRAAHGFVRGPLKQAALVSRPLFRPVARHVPSLSQIRGLTSEESSTTSLNIANPPAQTNGEIVHGVDEIDAALDDLESLGTLSLKEVAPPLDLADPAHLSTLNPRWTQAGLKQEVRLREATNKPLPPPSTNHTLSQVIDVLSNKTITAFTPVQAEAFSPALSGRDIIGRSRTGTGKTLAFGLPSVTRLYELGAGRVNKDGVRAPRGRRPSMIVMAPTRELARQVAEELTQIAKPLNLDVALFHGGVSYDPQARALKAGVDIIVATPGRCIDHLDRGNLDLSEINIAVLDEADEMLNMGFADDVENILEGAGSANGEVKVSAV